MIQLAYVNSKLVKLGILIRFDLNYLEANTNALMIRIRWLANQEKKEKKIKNIMATSLIREE